VVKTVPNPSIVSRRLKAAGITTTGAALRFKQEGVFVERGLFNVVVSIDNETGSLRRRIAQLAMEALERHGYIVEVVHSVEAQLATLKVTYAETLSEPWPVVGHGSTL
jgi:hypothetical protein